MFRSRSPGSHAGFTLVELVITLVIVGVLLSLAVPGFRDLLERNRLQSASSAVYTSLMFARSEALKRNQSVVMCKRDTAGTACDTSTPVDGKWEEGWLVYPASDPTEILNVREALSADDTLRLVDDLTTPVKLNALGYGADGSASSEAVFVLCNSDADITTARRVVVEVTGRPRRLESTSNCTP
jgi:type IV fimbrial biogenesis protein FimT